MKNKRILICVCTLLIFVVIGTIVFLLANKKENIYNQDNVYEMVVNINPSVKLFFSLNDEICSYGDASCVEKNTKINNFELLNDDANKIYKDIDFKDKNIMEALLIMSDTAKKNDIEFSLISITSNYSIKSDGIKDYIENKSEYDYDLTIDYNYVDNSTTNKNQNNNQDNNKKDIKIDILISKSLYQREEGKKVLDSTKYFTEKIVNKLRSDFPEANIMYDYKESGAEDFIYCKLIDFDDDNGGTKKGFQIPELCNKVLINGESYSFKYSRYGKIPLGETLHIPGNWVNQQNDPDEFIFVSNLDKYYGGSKEKRYKACIKECNDEMDPYDSWSINNCKECKKDCEKTKNDDEYSLYYDFYINVKNILES